MDTATAPAAQTKPLRLSRAQRREMASMKQAVLDRCVVGDREQDRADRLFSSCLPRRSDGATVIVAEEVEIVRGVVTRHRLVRREHEYYVITDTKPAQVRQVSRGLRTVQGPQLHADFAAVCDWRRQASVKVDGAASSAWERLGRVGK